MLCQLSFESKSCPERQLLCWTERGEEPLWIVATGSFSCNDRFTEFHGHIPAVYDVYNTDITQTLIIQLNNTDEFSGPKTNLSFLLYVIG